MASENKKVEQMKQEIAMNLRKKDYYDILGIAKNSDESEIKKAYKKMALRFHPDKNSVEGSKDVFKKVSNAYSNLIDPQKRANYDRFGAEEDRAPQYRPQRQYQQGYNQQDQFQEIFRAFFGGVPRQRNQNQNYQHFTFNMGGPRQANQGGNGSNMLYFFIIIFAIYILPLFFQKEPSLYSATPSNQHRFPLKTSKFQVPYYVREEYFAQNRNGQLTKQIEQAVDTEYYMKLKKQCDVEQWTRSSASAQGTRKQGKKSCAKLYQLQQNFQDYIRDLFYAY